MNPLYHNSPAAIGCASSGKAEQAEPKNTAEKIGFHLQKIAQSEQQNYLEQRLWRLEREGAEAIRILSEEIDALKAEIAALKEPKTSGEVSNGR